MSTETSSVSSNPNFVGTTNTSAQELKAAPAPEAKVDTTITAGAPESPIDIYEGKTGRPYLVDMMDISELYGKSDFESEIRDIDAYVLKEIESQKLTKTKASYSSIVNGLMAKMNIDPNLQYDQKISRIATYVSILNKEREMLLRRKAIEYAAANQRR